MDTQYSDKICNLFLIVLCIIPCLAGFGLISIFSTNVPFHDQWDNDVNHLIRFFEGNYTLTEMLSVHNDHRPIIPRLLYFPIQILSSGNFQLLPFIGMIIHTISFLLFISIIKEFIPVSRNLLLFCIPLSLYWFNLYLISAFLWGLSVDHSLCIFFAILTALLLYKSVEKPAFFYASLITATCSFFSFAAGLFIWIPGFIMLALQKRDDKIQKMVIWSASSLFIFILNYKILPFPSEGRHGLSGYIHYLITFFQYLPYKICNVVGSFGGQIIHVSYPALVAGFIMVLLIFLFWILSQYEDKEPMPQPILFLFIFSLIICVAITISRTGQVTDFGSPETFFFTTDWRQFPVTFLLIPCIYTYMMIPFLSSKDKKTSHIKYHRAVSTKNSDSDQIFKVKMIIVLAFIALVLLSVFGHAVFGLLQAHHWKQGKNEQILLNYLDMDDKMLKNLYPYNSEVVRKYAPKLEKYNLSVFKGT